MAWDGTNVLTIWSDRRSGRSADLVGTRLSVDGIVLDPDGAVLSRLRQDELSPAAAANDAGTVLVAYERYSSEDLVERVFFRLVSE